MPSHRLETAASGHRSTRRQTHGDGRRQTHVDERRLTHSDGQRQTHVDVRSNKVSNTASDRVKLPGQVSSRYSRRADRFERRRLRPERSTLRTIRAAQRTLAMLAVPIAVAMSLSYVVPNAQAIEPALVEIPLELQTVSVLPIATDASVVPIERDSYGVTAAPPPIVWPVAANSRRSDGFGARGGAHEGADINPPSGTPIVSVAAGIVIETNAPGYSALGTHVRIQHLIDGKVVVSVYGHMIAGSMPFKVGDRVAAGQLVGKVGNTGRSTGAHLHLEIRLNGTTPVDPIDWLNARVP